MIKLVKIFTDGSCLGNPGPGGCSAIIEYKNNKKILSVGYDFTTNNRMELMAAIMAMESLQERCMVELTTDSIYVKNGITKWIKNWKLNNWKTKKNQKVKNIDLWKRLNDLIQKHNVFWKWTKSHFGNKKNQKCDKLAKSAARSSSTLKDTGYHNDIIFK
ncbi:ribonuclease HI [Buchnera aphidicola (Mindarus keteleerifoliae)]|uniref:ribonuclease HI n=1 Tax=Buchnera aphidicola TaxID=9 RepID=UPI0031B6EBDD